MKKKVILLISLVATLMPNLGKTTEIYKVFESGRFDLYLNARYFKTVANFEANGEKKSLPNNSYLQDISLISTARYLFLNSTGVYSGLSFNNLESNNGTTNRTNSILTNFFLGIDYQFFQSKKWSLYTDIAYAFSNEKIDLKGDSALASSGASELKAQLVNVLKLHSFRSFVKVGYNHRTEGLSSLVLYGAGSEYILGTSAIGIELEGGTSVKDDELTKTAQVRETLTTRVNAGSKKHFSINPNSLEAQLYYSYAFDSNFVIKLNAGATVVGSNSADGYFAGLLLNLRFGGTSSVHKQHSKKVLNNSSLPDNEPGFKVETEDGVNQDLFKSAEPIKPKK